MAGVLYRLGRLCANRAVVVVAVWLGLSVVVRLVVWGVGHVIVGAAGTYGLYAHLARPASRSPAGSRAFAADLVEGDGRWQRVGRGIPRRAGRVTSPMTHLRCHPCG
jgi:hypothetical protein